jgi:hypothetical protein
MGRVKRTKPESSGKQKCCKNMSVAGSPWSVAGAYRTRGGPWWSLVCGQLLGQGNKLQAGPKTDHQKPKTEKRAKPEYERKEGAYKDISKIMSKIGGWLVWRSRSC